MIVGEIVEHLERQPPIDSVDDSYHHQRDISICSILSFGPDVIAFANGFHNAPAALLHFRQGDGKLSTVLGEAQFDFGSMDIRINNTVLGD